MFLGCIPDIDRRVLKNLLEKTDRKTPIYIGCSGNFTMEQVLTRMGFENIYSNDVSFYTTLIAHYLLDRKLEFSPSEYAREFFSQKDNIEDIVDLMYFYNLESRKKPNLYVLRQLLNLHEFEGDFRRKLREKLVKFKEDRLIKIKEFYCEDVVEYYKRVPENGIFLCFLPYYKGGYEKLYKVIDENISWKQPKYNVVDPKNLPDIYCRFLNEKQSLVYTNLELKEHTPLARIQERGKKYYVNVYSSVRNLYKHSFVKDKTKFKKAFYPVFRDDIDLSAKDCKLTFRRVDANVIYYYKTLFSAKRVDFSKNGEFNYLIFTDGKLIGLIAFVFMMGQHDRVFLHSNLAVPSEKYKRLSKLILMIAKSKYFRGVIEESRLRNIRDIYTTVYSEKPESMTYRGVFELEKRDPKTNRLIYRADFEDYSPSGAFNLWKQKYLKG